MKTRGLLVSLCIPIFLITSVFSQNTNRLNSKLNNKQSLAFVDATGREGWIYKTFLDILKAVGFKKTYISLDDLIDYKQSKLSLNSYDAIFFILGSDFVDGIRHKNYLTEKILEGISLVNRKDKLIGLVLPPMGGNPRLNMLLRFIPIFSHLGIDVPNLPFAPAFPVQQENSNQLALDAFFYAANRILVPIESRPVSYHTTLRSPGAGVRLIPIDFESMLGATGPRIFYLPVMSPASVTQDLSSLLPFGLYWFNPAKQNHIFITNLSLLTFAGISENFHICPIDYKVRNNILLLIEQMMAELRVLCKTGPNENMTAIKRGFEGEAAPLLPSSFEEFGKKHSMKSEKNPYRKLAWMEIPLFQKDEKKEPAQQEEQQKAQDFLINSIVDAGLDALWISFNPHVYYSTIGRLSKPDQEKVFLDGISCFTKKLKTVCEQKNKKIPAILVGFEITNNIYKPNLPTRFSIDIFGNKYPDLPTPLDRSFWQNEVEKPLEIFARKWAKPDISHGIPLSGVVLDLEMYCRKKSGIFTATMGFDGYTFNAFTKYMHMAQEDVSLQDRILLLMQKGLGRSYFNFLEKRAYEQGKVLKNTFNRLIKNCHIVCYLPSVTITWFYKGFCKGMTSQKNPIHLLTFNNEFEAHRSWFEQNNLPANHGSVLLLSKVKTREDFSLINDILLRGNIWFNRWSRWGEGEKSSTNWTSVEAPAPSVLKTQPLRDAFFEFVQNVQ